MEIFNRHLKFLSIVITILLVTSCNSQKEESYAYYEAHPDELEEDYQLCKKYPGEKFCVGINEKYTRYHKSKKSLSKTKTFLNIDSRTNKPTKK